MISLFDDTIHFMKKYRGKAIFFIFFIALILRVFKLGDFPVGFHVDEVKVGWNAISLATTLKDDQGHILPLYYNTFGDYRPTGIFYISAPALVLFGNTIFAVRFTSALIGALCVFPIYLLADLVFDKKKNIGTISAFILAISPWHIEVSRATSEVVISLFFVLFSIYFYIRLIKDKDKKYVYYTIVSIIISYFMYHSARLLLPIYLLVTMFTYYKKVTRFVLIPLFFSVIFTAILLIGGNSTKRLDQVSLFKSQDVKYELQQSKEGKAIVYTRNLVSEYGKYFSTDFLIGDQARPYRYLTVGVGLLNYIDLFLLITGLYYLFSKRNPTIILLFLLISPLASAITIEDAPNMHRSFYMMPFIAIIESLSFYYLKSKKIIFNVLIISLFYFLYSYFFKSQMHIPYIKDMFVDSPTYRDIGNIELTNSLKRYKDQYETIYVSNFPDNLYPWYAFNHDVNPRIFNTQSYIPGSNERRYENIVFTDTKCPSDTVFENNTKNILVVDSFECNTETKVKDGLKAKVIENIRRPDNSIVYRILVTQQIK